MSLRRSNAPTLQRSAVAVGVWGDANGWVATGGPVGGALIDLQVANDPGPGMYQVSLFVRGTSTLGKTDGASGGSSGDALTPMLYVETDLANASKLIPTSATSLNLDLYGPGILAFVAPHEGMHWTWIAAVNNGIRVRVLDFNSGSILCILKLDKLEIV